MFCSRGKTPELNWNVKEMVDGTAPGSEFLGGLTAALWRVLDLLESPELVPSASSSPFPICTIPGEATGD